MKWLNFEEFTQDSKVSPFQNISKKHIQRLVFCPKNIRPLGIDKRQKNIGDK